MTNWGVAFVVSTLIFCAPIPSFGQQSIKPTYAASSQCTNGCGPGGWLGTFVPNSLGSCKIKRACDNHDQCYGRCIKGCGDLVGKSECQGKHCNDAASKTRKYKCDYQLEKDIVDLNLGTCKAVAWAYRVAVVKCGCGYFNGFGAVDEKIKRERFQKDFGEALRAYEFQNKNPGTIDLEQQTETLRKLSEVDPLSENRLIFMANDRRPRLSLRSERPRSPQFAGPKERTIVNGVDVTEMEVDGKRFNLRSLRERSDFDARGLKQETLQER